jgi:hypothetical protein
MRRSDSIADLAAALAKAQGAIVGASKDKKGNYGAYATLASVWEAIREPLASNGLAVIQGPDGEELVTLLTHASGQWVESRIRCVLPPNPQQAGSLLTYLRRYSLSAIAGVAPADDDDGQAATDAVTPPKKAAKPSAEPKGGETPEQRATQFYARIDALASEPEINRWVQKWAPEINSLPAELAERVKSSVRARREQVGHYVPVSQRDGAPSGGEG